MLRAYVDQCSSPDIIRNALECELQGMAEKPVSGQLLHIVHRMGICSRKITGSLLVFRLLFCQESGQGDDFCVDALCSHSCLRVAIGMPVGSHVVCVACRGLLCSE